MLPDRWSAVRGKLIVSCQASPGDAFYGEGMMARFARAALSAGAAGLRIHGAPDIQTIRPGTGVPILGIHKEEISDGRILITPTFERAAGLVAAGADAVAVDCTARGQRYGALARVRQIRSELGVPVMADIATLEEAAAAIDAGALFVLPTMRGYTEDTRVDPGAAQGFDLRFLRDLCARFPVIAEGRVGTPEEARQALDAGAFAVVVGSAITRPQEITRNFVRAIRRPGFTGAIDLGGTNTKWGVVDPGGTLVASGSHPTPVRQGRERLLSFLASVTRECSAAAAAPLEAFGVAAAGWVCRESGSILYATGNIPEWTGAPLRQVVADATGLDVIVENDAVSAAAAEWVFGAAKHCRNFLCVTLGTGIGGGAVVEGRLLRGAHGLANMFGHIRIRPDDRECTCGLTGCLEAYAGSIGRGPDLASKLAEGLATAVHLFDPECIVLSGGVIAGNPQLAGEVERSLAPRILAGACRRLHVRNSPFPAMAGVLGAAALARCGGQY